MKYITAIFLLACLLASCKKENVAKTYKVTYSMVCTDCEAVYTKDSTGAQQTEYHQNSSWHYTFYGAQGQQVLFLAYNTGAQIQGVTATISVNDSVTETQTNYCPVSGDAFVVDTL